jgi:hypothetical protein
LSGKFLNIRKGFSKNLDTGSSRQWMTHRCPLGRYSWFNMR